MSGGAAASAGRLGGQAPRSGAASPRTVIRGESPQPLAAIIDYLRFTFLPSGSVSDALLQLQRYMRLWFPVPVNFVPSDKGIFGYESSYDVKVWANGEMVRVAIIAMGGGTAGGTMCLDMSGMGCALVEDWQAVYATLQDLDARITRADTALDLMEGFTVDQFDDMYFRGEFNCGGRIPSRRYTESGDSKRADCYGKTLYLGKKANGKELCIYAKGKQLGDSESEWVRVEVRFGNRDRVIKHDIVLNPSKYFAGAFIALENLIDTVPEKIRTEQNDAEQPDIEQLDPATEEYRIALRRLVHYCKVGFGKAVWHEAQRLDLDFKALFDSIAVKGNPRRLEKSTVAGGLRDAQVPASS